MAGKWAAHSVESTASPWAAHWVDSKVGTRVFPMVESWETRWVALSVDQKDDSSVDQMAAQSAAWWAHHWAESSVG